MGLQATSITYKHSIYPHYFLCNYLPMSAGRDRLSRSLLDFKQGLQPDLGAWTDCAVEVFQGIPYIRDTIIVRALQHDETAATDDPPASLDLLGRALASRFHCQYLPGLLCKSGATPPCKALTRRQRMAGLRNVYSFLPLPDPAPSSGTPPLSGPPAPHPRFLLIDDILTTGTTARMILGAIHQVYPGSPFGVFTLAKSGYTTTPAPTTALHGRRYHLGPDSQWIVSEGEPTPYSIKELKILILANSF